MLDKYYFYTYGLNFSPYIKNDVHIMGSHIVSTLKAHDLLKVGLMMVARMTETCSY